MKIVSILDSMSIEKFQKISPKRLTLVQQSLCFVFGLSRVSCSSNSTISSLLKCKFVIDPFRNECHRSLVSVNELFVDIPEGGNAERIPVHIDISVMNIACQCKRREDESD